jgi:CBS domain containing-hemolysin-like protein
MAMAVDEFGTVVGVVTLEDVVEEVVGELYEHHEQEPITVVNGEQAEVDGWATVEHVNEALTLALPTDGPFETVAGLVAHHVNRVGETGDSISFDGVGLTVLEATERGVTRVRLDWGGGDDGNLAGDEDADRPGNRDNPSTGDGDGTGIDNPET